LQRNFDHRLLAVAESCSSKRVCIVLVPDLSFGGFLVAWSNGAVPEPLFDTALKAAAPTEAFEASSPVPTMRIHALPPKAPTVHASTNADHAQTLMP
jgi:hypothetical protein